MAGALPLDYDLERQQLARKRAIAEALLQQSAAPMGGTETVSGIAVRQSPLAGLARLGQAYFAKQNVSNIEGQEKDLGQRQREDVAAALGDYQKAITPRPSTSENIVDEQASGGEGAPATITAPAFNPTPQDKQAAALVLLGRLGGNPADTAKLVVAQALKGGPKLSEINPKDYTPESFSAYQRSGDVTLLRAAPPQAKPAGPTELQRLITERDALPANDPRRATYDDAIKKATTQTPPVSLTVDTGKRYGEQFAGKIAQQDADLREAAQKAPDLASRANRIKQTLAAGKVITGAGADYRLALGKAMNLAGASDAETIANTETLAADLAKNTLDAIKQSGLGSGTGFSNADRAFLERAVGGQITLQKETIDRLATLAHRAAEKSAERWTKRVKEIPAEALQGTGIKPEPVTVEPLFTPGAAKPRVSPDVQRLLDKYAPEGQ